MSEHQQRKRIAQAEANSKANKTRARQDPSSDPASAEPHWPRRQSLLYACLPLLLIIIVALTAYANAWPNSLVLDDKLFENNERFRSWSNLPGYFAENAWASEGFVTELYRPLLLVTITLDTRMYGDWVAGFHLTNIFLHVFVCLLLYDFLLQVLHRTNGQSQTAALYALLAALLYDRSQNRFRRTHRRWSRMR